MVTGVCGMVGSHLAARLLDSGVHVVGTFYKPTIDMDELDRRIELREVDIRYSQHCANVVSKYKPAVIFHLAAQSYPAVSWERPHETLETNVIGTANVFEAVRAARESDVAYDPVVVVACSSAEYGMSLMSLTGPATEDAALLPMHPYGVSKVATDLLAYQYFVSQKIRSVRARIFNCSGPRKSGDVISDFARRIANLPLSGGTISVGSMSTRRAFLHVSDLVDALMALASSGSAGEVYNISGESTASIGELIPLFEAVSGKAIATEQSATLLRPNDEPIIIGSNARITAQTGWRPKKSIPTIVEDVYRYEDAKHNRKSRSA